MLVPLPVSSQFKNSAMVTSYSPEIRNNPLHRFRAFSFLIFAFPFTIPLTATFEAKEVTDLKVVVNHLLGLTASTDIFLFRGEMGAGKTTLIRVLCEALGVMDDISSPTFSLVNTYEGSEGPIHHFDLYRINGPDELLDIGIEEYLDSGYLCLVEWPEVAPDLFPKSHVAVDIGVRQGTRIITVKSEP